MLQKTVTSAQPTSLHQSLMQRVLAEAGEQIKSPDDNRALVAECEVLADRLKVHGLNEWVFPAVTPHSNSISARVIVFRQPISTIRAAIRGAGLHIYKEEPVRDFDSRDGEIVEVRFELCGLDCPVIAQNISAELAEAA